MESKSLSKFTFIIIIALLAMISIGLYYSQNNTSNLQNSTPNQTLLLNETTMMIHFDTFALNISLTVYQVPLTHEQELDLTNNLISHCTSNITDLAPYNLCRFDEDMLLQTAQNDGLALIAIVAKVENIGDVPIDLFYMGGEPGRTFNIEFVTNSSAEPFKDSHIPLQLTYEVMEGDVIIGLGYYPIIGIYPPPKEQFQPGDLKEANYAILATKGSKIRFVALASIDPDGFTGGDRLTLDVSIPMNATVQTSDWIQLNSTNELISYGPSDVEFAVRVSKLNLSSPMLEGFINAIESHCAGVGYEIYGEYELCQADTEAMLEAARNGTLSLLVVEAQLVNMGDNPIYLPYNSGFSWGYTLNVNYIMEGAGSPIVEVKPFAVLKFIDRRESGRAFMKPQIFPYCCGGYILPPGKQLSDTYSFFALDGTRLVITASLYANGNCCGSSYSFTLEVSVPQD